MKSIKRLVLGIAFVVVFAYAFNIQYVGELLNIIGNAAVECVSGGDEYSTRLKEEMNTLSVSKFIDFGFVDKIWSEEDSTVGEAKLSKSRINYYYHKALNNNDSKSIILGTIGKYDAIGEAKGYTYFKMDDDTWAQLEAETNNNYDEIWKVNEEFLKRQIKKRKRIFLADDPSKGYFFEDGNRRFYQREIDYLSGLGYRFEKGDDNLWEAIL